MLQNILTVRISGRHRGSTLTFNKPKSTIFPTHVLYYDVSSDLPILYSLKKHNKFGSLSTRCYRNYYIPALP